MRDKHYKVKQARVDDEVWEKMKQLKALAGLSWNQLFKELISKYDTERSRLVSKRDQGRTNG